MAGSPTSRQRSNLLREMSRDLAGVKKRAPSISDHGSVTSSAFSDFDPENEALMSTRQLERSSILPGHKQPSQRVFDSDIAINMPALSKAFPDLTGSDTSESIELGRGILKNSNRGYEAPYDDSILSQNPRIGNFEVTGTPPMRPVSTRNDRKTSTKSGRVTEQPNTRREEKPEVRNGSQRQKKPLPTRFTTREALLRQVAAGQSEQTNAFSTQPSFILPDLPNISELVSGVFEDGTPVFTRTKRGSSRFTDGRHAPISSIPVPEEERAILISLRVLQDKVADLELEKSQWNKTVQDLREHNSRLKADNERLEKDRRSDSALGMVDSDDDKRGKTKELEGEIKTLHSKLGLAQRELSAAQSTVKTLTAERDNATAQLGVAYVTTEELKAENEKLRKELGSLKKHLIKTLGEREDDTKKWAAAESRLRAQLERAKEKPKREDTERSVTHRSIRVSIANQVKREVERLGKAESKSKQPNTIALDSDDDESADISNIRRHFDNYGLTDRENPTAHSRRSAAQSTQNHKSSFKRTSDESRDDNTGRFSIRRGHIDNTVASSIKETQHTQQSSRPKGRPDLTSAFIIPDITFTGPAAGAVLSDTAKHVLGGLTKHEVQNCSICRKLTCSDPSKCHVTVPRPVAVSDRMPEPGEWTEEPTSRPVHPPAIALAIVLKELEDEYAHMKIDLARLQSVYNAKDPSLGKRQRKILFQRIERLVKAIDSKADQIYALYDVVEGHKTSGHEMDDEELQLTLSTIGIHLGKGKNTHNLRSGVVNEDSENTSNSDSEDELPWEGIEDLTGISGKSKASRRKSWKF